MGNMRLIPLIFGDLYGCAVATGLLPSSQSKFIEHEGVIAMKEWDILACPKTLLVKMSGLMPPYMLALDPYPKD